ncbi:MAG TPA: ABC transporter permease [Candidatus Limnocylindrales bacterium]|nr:ABC transporter permease [Candidatus Limnocylindrales bacterium]
MSEAVARDPYAGLTSQQVANWYGLRARGARPKLGEYARQVWRYRHFITTFASARVTSLYSKALLGRLWQAITPLVNALVYYLVFGVVLNTRANIENFTGYLVIGVFLFGFTQSIALAGVNSVSGNLNLIRSLQFPRASLPLAAALTQIKQMITAVGVLVAIIVVSGEQFETTWLLLLPVLILQVIFSVGLALGLARLGSNTSDVGQLMPFVMRTWLYASGVFYGVDTFDKYLPPIVAEILKANPLLVYIQLARDALLDTPLTGGSQPVVLWALAVGWAIVGGFAGFAFFWRGEQDYGRA